MSARQPWLFCLSTMFGSALALSACSSDDDIPVGGASGSSLSGGANTGVSGSGGTGDTTGNSGDGDAGGDGDDGSGTAGDGDSGGDGDGDSGDSGNKTDDGGSSGDSSSGTAGDGDGTGGDGDSGGNGQLWQVCVDLIDATQACGLTMKDAGFLYDACQDAFDTAQGESTNCLVSVNDYWTCRNQQPCSDFFFEESGSDTCLETHAPDTNCNDSSWLP